MTGGLHSNDKRLLPLIDYLLQVFYLISSDNSSRGGSYVAKGVEKNMEYNKAHILCHFVLKEFEVKTVFFFDVIHEPVFKGRFRCMLNKTQGSNAHL